MMKLARVLLCLALALGAPAPVLAQVGPINPILCNQTAPFTGTAAPLIVITGVAGTQINICGWSMTNSAASGSFAITFGSGAGCGTNTVNVTGVLNVGSTAVTDHSSYATSSSGQGNSVCVNATATVTGILYFSKT